MTQEAVERDFYTFAEAAELLGVTRFKIWYTVKQGYWKPSHYYGKTYFVEKSELPALEAAIKSIGTVSRKCVGKFLAKQGES